MKIWKWYKNLTNEQYENAHDLSLADKYPLYAFTTSKSHRDLFRKMRKKEAFIEIKSTIGKEEYVEFANKNRGCLLEMYKYPKIVGYDDRTPVMEDVELLTTWNEKEYTEAAIEGFSDSGSGFCIQTYPFPPMIFKDEYFKALYILQYVDFWRMYTDFRITEQQEDMLKKLGVEIDYSYPEVMFDEFAIFVNIFSDTLK